MTFFIWYIKSFFCKHTFAWNRDIHGDEIILRGWKRSEWYCTKPGCRLIRYRDGLYEQTKEQS